MDVWSRFREITTALLRTAVVAAVLGVIRAFSGGMSAMALGWGPAAAGGHRRERRRHVMESRERREALRRLRRSNASQHPVGTDGSTVDPEERLAQLRAWEEQHPVTRRGVAERLILRRRSLEGLACRDVVLQVLDLEGLLSGLVAHEVADRYQSYE